MPQKLASDGREPWFAGSLSAVLFPDQCRLCERPLRAFSSAPVCSACLEAVLPAAAPYVCVCCGLPLESAAPLHGVDRCGLCRLRTYAFDLARGFGVYEGSLRRLIHLLKYDKMRPLARPLAACMARRLCELGPLDMIVPVPLFVLRKWRRGFNQADLLAGALSQESGIPWSRRILRRVRATPPQVGLSHHQRRLNLAGAFAVRGEAVRGRNVVLVDDVMTTGATLDACARVLKAAGATRVAGLTAARARRRMIDGSEFSASGGSVLRGLKQP